MKSRFSIVLVVAMIPWVCVSTSFAAPIHDAAEDGNTAEVTRLIAENPANRDAVNENGSTPLHIAADKGHTTTVQAIVASGANVKARDPRDFTPLHIAAANAHTAIVQTLLASGADVNVANKWGDTPLELAQFNLTPHNGYAAIIDALQPEAIAQLHTQTADAHTTAGNHALAARSHTWAAQALPGTEEARINHTRAAESHTLHAHAQAAAGDYTSAVEHYRLSHAAHKAVGNHEAAGLSHVMANRYAPIVDGQLHTHTMESHFRSALAKVGEIQDHRTRGDEAAAALAEAQLQESLESADRSAAHANSAFEAALTTFDGVLVGAMNAHDEAAAAQVTDAPAEHIAQHSATVDSLRAHIKGVSRKIEETRESAATGRERVSAAREI